MPATPAPMTMTSWCSMSGSLPRKSGGGHRRMRPLPPEARDADLEHLRALTPLQGAHVDDVGVRTGIGTGRIDCVLLNLLGSRRWQALHDVDPTRRLVVGEPLRAMPKQHLGHVFRRFWLAQDHASQD